MTGELGGARRHGLSDGPPIEELGRVVLRRDVLLEYVGFLPNGSAGTVLAVLGAGAAYLVEFTSPLATLVTLTGDELLPSLENSYAQPVGTNEALPRRGGQGRILPA